MNARSPCVGDYETLCSSCRIGRHSNLLDTTVRENDKREELVAGVTHEHSAGVETRRDDVNEP